MLSSWLINSWLRLAILAVHHARHIAMLEHRELSAWLEYQKALGKVGAGPVYDARRIAADRVFVAEYQMGR
jgi:hypothetical protein